MGCPQKRAPGRGPRQLSQKHELPSQKTPRTQKTHPTDAKNTANRRKKHALRWGPSQKHPPPLQKTPPRGTVAKNTKTSNHRRKHELPTQKNTQPHVFAFKKIVVPAATVPNDQLFILIWCWSFSSMFDLFWDVSLATKDGCFHQFFLVFASSCCLDSSRRVQPVEPSCSSYREIGHARPVALATRLLAWLATECSDFGFFWWWFKKPLSRHFRYLQGIGHRFMEPQESHAARRTPSRRRT